MSAAAWVPTCKGVSNLQGLERLEITETCDQNRKTETKLSPNIRPGKTVISV